MVFDIRFTTVRFGAGYDMEDVDQYLARLEAAVRAQDGSISPQDVLNQRFRTTRFGDGYAADEVDRFLDETVVPLLEGRHEAGPDAGAPAPQPSGRAADQPAPRSEPNPSSGSALHPAEPRPGLLRRVFGGAR